MIVNERIATYLRSLERPEREIVERIEKEALEEGVPVIRKETQSFLKLLLKMKAPFQVLEIGTGVGFSAVLMCEYLPDGAMVTTVENYRKRIPTARENILRAGREKQIVLIEGDAMDVLEKLEGPYDFIFLDAAKGQYIRYLPQMLRVLSPGGVLVSDNVLQEGDVAESRFALERRDRTIHSRMREYLYALKNKEQLLTSILPLGDGVAVSVKQDGRH